MFWLCLVVAERRTFGAAERAAYLEGLRRTGTHAAAAREVGFRAATVRRHRGRCPDFEAQCREAEADADRRLAEARSPYDGAREGAFESIRRGPDGRLKIQAQGRRRWSRKAEDLFFDVLRECGNISAAARAAGVSRRTVWLRRRDWPAFARRFEETMEEAEIVLEYRVACLGTNWSEAAEAAGEADELTADDGEGTGEGTRTFSGKSTCPHSCPPAFDPELALRFLKWRSELKRGRPDPAMALPSPAEVRQRILRKVEAVKRHRALETRRPGGGNGDGRE
jgi:hypothetical protein